MKRLLGQPEGMKNKPTLADVTTSDPETAQIGQPLSEVYTLLQNRGFHHVPVIDDSGVPVGMISATDILKLVYDVDGHDEPMLRTFLDHQFTLEDAMTTDLVTVQAGDPLHKVVDQMADGSVHSVMVLNDDGGLDGIVTTTDLVRQLGALL
jgi:acetoin utilization protein AcuB